jgi:hypothetical protein
VGAGFAARRALNFESEPVYPDEEIPADPDRLSREASRLDRRALMAFFFRHNRWGFIP